jgi:hypothetical protein
MASIECAHSVEVKHLQFARHPGVGSSPELARITVGGSLRDIQMLAGHTNLRTTQRYIDANPDAQIRVVELV